MVLNLGINLVFSLKGFLKPMILYKDEHSCIILKIVGVLDFPILTFDYSKCSQAFDFSSMGLYLNGGLRIWSQNPGKSNFPDNHWLFILI